MRFRNQMKAIFHHILQQFAFTDADVVWNDIVDGEFEKPKTTKGMYVVSPSATFLQNRGSLNCRVFHFSATTK